MELVKLHITAEFVRDRTALTWREVLFGIDNELLSPEAAVDLAAGQVATLEAPAPALLELAGLSPGEPTRHLVESLAAAADAVEDRGALQKKWLYLVLAWIFEHRSSYPEPLRAVEEVYADFGYPEAVASFVRFMPMIGPDLGSKEDNERRLFESWKQYLDEASREYGR